MPFTLQCIQGDITELDVDAIVNAANSTLLGGGGVDGAIHDAAGPRLLEACRQLGGCPTGDAKITAGYDLKARWIIHAVGPVWNGGNAGEEQLLAACYRKSVALAQGAGAASLAFPCISTGAYRFPKKRAAHIAVATCKEVLAASAAPLQRVLFVCFDPESLGIYRQLTKE